MPILDAIRIAREVRAGDLNAAEVVAESLARIAASQPSLNAFVTLCEQEALREAQRIDAARPALPLAGVPFSAKDNIETAGLRTTFGSRTLAGNVPAVEAAAVTRLRRAGAILVGKTTLPEFASSLLAYSPLTGHTRNPWNLDMSPGGSSSGAAAAVAAGLTPIALATDAGASTRLPAACCGVLGLKPSSGLVPYELFPDGFGNFIHMGLLTRTVADLAAALDAVSGEHPDDPLTIGVAPTRALVALETPFEVSGQRIAWRPLLGNADLDAEVRALCEAALQCLTHAGARVTEVNEAFEGAGPTWRVLQQLNWAGRFGTMDDAVVPLMDAGFVAGVRAGHDMRAADATRAVYRRTAYFRIVQSWFQRFDWIATPVTTVAGVAAEATGTTPLLMNGKPGGELRSAWAPYLNVFNFSGHPALSIPAGWTAAGMPVGVQLVGRLYADADLLRLARLIERARPWAGRIPPHASV